MTTGTISLPIRQLDCRLATCIRVITTIDGPFARIARWRLLEPTGYSYVLVVHESASEGYSKQADTYRNIRPSYHPALVRRFADRYGSGPVVDLGAGTGIFTAQLLKEGLNPIAVEPVHAMRTILKRDLPTVRVEEGTAEQIPLLNDSAVTVVVAQAFHWFKTRAALDEIHRVLKPGGALVTVWNVRDEDVDWVSKWTDVVDVYAGDTPRYRTMKWRKAIEQDNRFAEVDDWSVFNPKHTTASGVVDRALSTSFIANLSSAEQDVVRQQVLEIVEPLGPSFASPYRSELQAWRKLERRRATSNLS